MNAQRQNNASRGLNRSRDTRPALLNRALLTALACGSAYGFSMSSFYLLPAWLAGDLGASADTIGSVTATCALATVLAAPLVARWADRVALGRLAAMGSATMAVSAAAFYFVESVGPAMYLLRAVHGATFTVVFTSLNALVARLAPRERLSQAMGLVGASMLVMNAIAPALMEPLAHAAGWRLVFAIAAASATLATGLALAVPGGDAAVPATPAARGTGRAMMDRRQTRQYALVSAVTGCAFGVMFTFTPPMALELGRDQVAGFFAAYAGAAVFVRLLLGGLPDRVGRFRTAVVSLHVYVAAVAATPLLGADALYLAGLVLGLAHGLFFPSLHGMVLAATPAREHGRMMALFVAAFYGGMSAGAWGLGELATVAGYQSTYLVAAALLLVVALGFAFSREFSGRPRPLVPGQAMPAGAPGG
ncbi:MAG: MFS transporter [Proteobacteria bacterium]|nr:MFS transporter [Pseudomonadota bacterium]